MTRHRILLVCAAALVGGCADGLGPKNFSGTYGLFAALQSEAPPITVYIGSTRTTIYQRIELLADTIELSGDGTYVERTVYRGTQNETTNPVVTIDTTAGGGTFSVNDDSTLTFVVSVSPPSLCGFLCGLQVKTPTTVFVRRDTLAFANVAFGGLAWNPVYARRP
jgi:hypothetical protein